MGNISTHKINKVNMQVNEVKARGVKWTSAIYLDISVKIGNTCNGNTCTSDGFWKMLGAFCKQMSY